jgi:S1-C subfamily serine protease
MDYLYAGLESEYVPISAYIPSSSAVDMAKDIFLGECRKPNSLKVTADTLFRCWAGGVDEDEIELIVANSQRSDSALSIYRSILNKANSYGMTIGAVSEKRIAMLFSLYGIENLSLDRLQSTPKKENLPTESNELMVFVEQLPPKEVITDTEVQSQYIVGVDQSENPDFRRAQINYNNALRAKEDCLNQYYVNRLTNPYAINLCGLLEIAVSSAASDLASTPQVLRKNVYENYSFLVKKSDVTVERRVTVVGRGIKGQLESVSEIIPSTRNFSFEKGMRQDDTQHTKNNFDSDEDVREFLSTEFNPSLTDINRIVAENEVKPLSALPATKMRNTKARSAQQVPFKASNDELILSNSIVLISTRDGIGAGFYVRPNHVLTNYHVVGNAPIVKVSRKKGDSSSGVVLAFDQARDLALIVVPELAGEPLPLLDREPVLGEEVKAYGHPKGYLFSVAKGIVSSTRQMSIKSAALDQFATFVQSDVAVSPGNSGGPLIQGENVIAITSWKRTGNAVEGLSFSVSSSEALSWMSGIPSLSQQSE